MDIAFSDTEYDILIEALERLPETYPTPDIEKIIHVVMDRAGGGPRGLSEERIKAEMKEMKSQYLEDKRRMIENVRVLQSKLIMMKREMKAAAVSTIINQAKTEGEA